MQSGYTCLSYQIQALTNLHVGSGEENYGLIDKLVQRDLLTGLPCVHPSSLKGAIKQYLDARGMISSDQRFIFGSDAAINKGLPGSDYQSGEYIFLGAQLLALPLRGNLSTYVLATSPLLLDTFAQFQKEFGLAGAPDLPAGLNTLLPKPEETQGWLIGAEHKGMKLENLDLELKAPAEEFQTKAEALRNWLGGTDEVLAIIPDAQMRQCCSDLNLPVIPRNALNEGISVNLWYEQVLPRQTRMAAFFLAPEGDKRLPNFDAHLSSGVVQMGANASVGYGFTRFHPVHIPVPTPELIPDPS